MFILSQGTELSPWHAWRILSISLSPYTAPANIAPSERGVIVRPKVSKPTVNSHKIQQLFPALDGADTLLSLFRPLTWLQRC
jgi:sulfur relay (sulfurtransferase) DsrC/TusE family protein